MLEYGRLRGRRSVAQLIERSDGVREVAGLSPVTPTKVKKPWFHDGPRLFTFLLSPFLNLRIPLLERSAKFLNYRNPSDLLTLTKLPQRVSHGRVGT